MEEQKHEISEPFEWDPVFHGSIFADIALDHILDRDERSVTRPTSRHERLSRERARRVAFRLRRHDNCPKLPALM